MSFAFALGDRYVTRASVVHRADGRVKLALTLGYVLLVSATQRGEWLALVALALPVVALVGVARLPPGVVLRRSALALPFVLAAVPLAFSTPGEALGTLPPFGWTVTREGLSALATILAKSWTSVVLATVLTASTTPTELVHALRGLRVPALLAAVIFFTYRYLFTIGDEGSRLMRSRDSRSAAIAGYRSGGTLRWRASVLGRMVGTLFLRSYERSERVFAAMQARGYDGEPRFLDPPALRRADLAAAVLLLLYAALVQAYARVG
ncbi:MAG: cobalt ECF transporter T component CbiQ [Chloroflexi bacterium]|nr:cobalt ECF transporter T component CbiQ [Chloroflexota bacterium]